MLLQGGDDLRRGVAAAVGVVVQIAGRSVVDDTVGSIVAGHGAGRGEEARIVGDVIARRTDGREDVVVEYEFVGSGAEVRNSIGGRRVTAQSRVRRIVEDEVVGPRAADEQVVAGRGAGGGKRKAAVEPV